MNQFLIQDNEIPFHILNRFGLTEEMVDDLPEKVREGLLKGEVSPVLTVKISENGQTLPWKSRLCLLKDATGKVDVIFYPNQKIVDLAQFSDDKKKAPVSSPPSL